MSFMIESEVSKQYLLEEDAVEGFRQAVNNGQVRLALQILVDIIDVFEAVIASAVEDDDDNDETKAIEEVIPEPIKSSNLEKQENSVEVKEEVKEIVEEKKTATKKPATKSEEATQVTAEQ